MLNATERGSGESNVVALHGFLGSGRNLGALVRAWTDRDPSIRVHAPDLPGHGRSPSMVEGATYEDLADAVLHWMDMAQLRSARFVGHSLGGRIGLLCRSRAPQRIASLDLLDITPGPIPEVETDAVLTALAAAPDRADDRAQMLRPLADHGLSDPLVEWLSMNLERSPAGVTWRIDRRALADFHRRTRSRDLWELVEAKPAGLRLLKGGRSDYVPVSDVQRLRGLGASVEDVPTAGHFIHVDATSQVVDWLLSA